MTALIYVVIIVALLTYFIMFNINSLAQGFGQVYNIKKRRVVHAMKNDSSESWKVLGQRFEVFRPRHENPEPSEWLIPFYALLHPGSLFGFGGHLTNPPIAPRPITTEEASQSGWTMRLFRRRQPQAREPEEPDQPWVIE